MSRPVLTTIPDSKTCTRCGKHKPINQFYMTIYQRPKSECSRCSSENALENYYRRRDKLKG